MYTHPNVSFWTVNFLLHVRGHSCGTVLSKLHTSLFSLELQMQLQDLSDEPDFKLTFWVVHIWLCFTPCFSLLLHVDWTKCVSVLCLHTFSFIRLHKHIHSHMYTHLHCYVITNASILILRQLVLTVFLDVVGFCICICNPFWGEILL